MMAMRWIQFVRVMKWYFLIGNMIFLSSRAWGVTYPSQGQSREAAGRYFLLSQNPGLDEQEYNLAPSIGLGFGRSYGSGSGSQFQSSGTMIASGILAFIPGFGVGHAVQGRWAHDGWRYTFGELGSVGIMALGAVGKNGELFVAGALGFIYFKVAEIVSIFGGSHMPGLRWLASNSTPCQLTHGAQDSSPWAWCFQKRI